MFSQRVAIVFSELGLEPLKAPEFDIASLSSRNYGGLNIRDYNEILVKSKHIEELTNLLEIYNILHGFYRWDLNQSTKYPNPAESVESVLQSVKNFNCILRESLPFTDSDYFLSQSGIEDRRIGLIAQSPFNMDQEKTKLFFKELSSAFVEGAGIFTSLVDNLLDEELIYFNPQTRRQLRSLRMIGEDLLLLHNQIASNL